MKHIVCYSGGHSSALVAIAVADKYGPENTILLNHDISPEVEVADVKRFKREIADHLGLPITYANMKGWEDKSQFDVSVEIGAWKAGTGKALCTYYMKTAPFAKWLKERHPVAEGETCEDCVLYYGFDADEQNRIATRSGILGTMGYRTDYPLALWGSVPVTDTRAVGIEPPNTYGMFKHANCIGCLKAGMQHWYIVYCERRDLFEKAKAAEEKIGYTIHQEGWLEELETDFEKMRQAGVEPTEHVQHQTFWARAKQAVAELNQCTFDFASVAPVKPCECVF